MRTLTAVAGVLLALLTACSHGSASQSTGPTVASAATAKTSDAARWTPLITLRQLGAFETRCANRSDFAVRYRADPLQADETVRFVQDGRPRLKRKVDPGEHWVTPLGRVREQVWRITQRTEPQLVTAVVHIRPSRCPYGIPNTRVKFGTTHFNAK